MKTLYKRTNTGAVQTWTIEVDGNRYKMVTGQLDGKKIESKWTVCKGKNIGKSNETTPEEQAVLEAQSKFQKKLDSGYKEDVNQIDTVEFKPMLAKKFNDYENFVIGEFENDLVWTQAKLDGIRVIAKEDGLWTRTGKRHENLAHIEEELKPFFKQFPDAILDGEVYNHSLKNDFNKICSIVRKTLPTDEDREYSSQHAEYWIYDCASVYDNFWKRIHWLQDNLFCSFNFSMIYLVPTNKISNIDELNLYENKYIEDGFEGQMIRVSDTYYEQGKRSKSLLKRKRFIDEEFEIIDIEEGVGNRSGVAGKVILKTEDGKLFGSGIRGDHVFYEHLLKNKEQYIGKLATIRYFNRTTDENIPRFPVFISVRDYE